MGIGIVGKEGKQASLAADFSLTKFSHVGPLLMVHSRNSYKRSASLSQFVIHRGLIITVMQVLLSFIYLGVNWELLRKASLLGSKVKPFEKASL